MNILVTGIAGDIGQAIATIVKEEFPKWQVVGTDIHDRHGAELYAGKWYLAPKAYSPEYGRWIEALVQSEKIDLCIPTSEAELRFFASNGETIIAGAKLIMPGAQAINVGSDKLETASFLKSIGCPAPWTISADKLDSSTPFPCVFKPRHSAGSKGVFICNSISEVHLLSARFPEAVLQELLLPEDREVTCAIYRTKNGRIAVLQLLRKLAGGLTAWAQVINDNDVLRQCELLAEALQLQGSINAQLRLTPKGPRIFEINARFSSTVLMRHKMGYQDVVWNLKEVMGEEINLFTPPQYTTAVRVHGASLLKST